PGGREGHAAGREDARLRRGVRGREQRGARVLRAEGQALAAPAADARALAMLPTGASNATTIPGLAALGLAVLAAAPPPAEACARAREATELVGWSSDGRHALYVRATPDGTLDHAEIIPTRLAEEPVLWIWVDGGEVIVRKKTQVRCGPWSGTIVEKSELARGEKLTTAALPERDTVKRVQ